MVNDLNRCLVVPIGGEERFVPPEEGSGAIVIDAAATPTFSVSCENHGGPGLASVTQWDAAAGKWNVIAPFAAPDMDVIGPLIAEDSAAFAAENNITPACK